MIHHDAIYDWKCNWRCNLAKKNNIKMAQLAMELSGLFSWLDSEHFVTLADGGSQSEQPNYV